MDKERDQFAMEKHTFSQEIPTEWDADKTDAGVTRLRFWQFADGLNQSPYLVSSPLPYYKGSMVQGRLCGMSSYGTTEVLEDLHQFAHERGLFLRIYTATVKGGDLLPFPNSVEELKSKKSLILNHSMTVFLRNQIIKVLQMPEDCNLQVLLAKNPSLLNRLWENPLFSNINLMGWTSAYCFGRKTYDRLTFYALRDKSCFADIRCSQNPGIKKSDMLIV